MNRAQRRNLLKVKNKPKHNRASVAASKAEEGITASNAQHHKLKHRCYTFELSRLKLYYNSAN